MPVCANSHVKDDEALTGYNHTEYAKSLNEFGIPCELRRSKGWILKRHIPGFPEHDAIGIYPLFCCQKWLQLGTDLKDLRENSRLVCLYLVTDPFGKYDFAYLNRCFKDTVFPFKEHFVVDLSRGINTYVAEHHRRYAQKALKSIRVERCSNPPQFADTWIKLYANLINRHQIVGIQAFSEAAFIRQLKIPGLVSFRAMHEGNTVGMLLWYVQGDIGYYHLGAFSDLGYRLRASFALFWFALEYFKEFGLNWLNLGAGAGLKDNKNDGLARFKYGWSTGTRTAFFCGHIFDRKKYFEIVKAKSVSVEDYFPAYRKGEFA